MGIIEALKVLLAASGHEDWYEFAPGERHITTIAAQSAIGSLAAEFERLAPDWDDAPEGATHYIIHADGKAEWCRVMSGKAVEPIRNGHQWSYQFIQWATLFALVDIPVGVDWRLCIWQRPEAQPLDTSCPVCGMEH